MNKVIENLIVSFDVKQTVLSEDRNLCKVEYA